MDQTGDYLAHPANGVGLLAHSSKGTGAGPSAEPVMRFASQSRWWNPSAFLPEEPDPSCSVLEICMTHQDAECVTFTHGSNWPLPSAFREQKAGS